MKDDFILFTRPKHQSGYPEEKVQYDFVKETAETFIAEAADLVVSAGKAGPKEKGCTVQGRPFSSASPAAGETPPMGHGIGATGPQHLRQAPTVCLPWLTGPQVRPRPFSTRRHHRSALTLDPQLLEESDPLRPIVPLPEHEGGRFPAGIREGRGATRQESAECFWAQTD